MKLRNTLHLALLVPSIFGLVLLLFLIFRAAGSGISGAPFPEEATRAWDLILEKVPIEMPQEWEDIDEDLNAGAEMSEKDKQEYGRNNAFIVSCSLLAIGGIIGLGMMGASRRNAEPAIHSYLRLGGISGVAVVSFALWGYNTAFPGDFGNGVIPFPSISFPEDISPIEFGMDGMSLWTDLLFAATYAAVFGCLILTVAGGKQTATSAFLVAAPLTALIYPLTIAWKWGGGWIDRLSFSNYDFAGAALIHWHAGAVVLVISVITAVVSGNRSIGTEPAQKRHQTLSDRVLWIVGSLLFAGLMLGFNAGSVLAATPGMVAAVVQSTLIAGGTAMVLSLLWSAVFRSRNPLEWAAHGLIAGMVVVSGAPDYASLPQSIVIGSTAGFLIPPAIAMLDHLGSSDTLAIGPVHGIGGFIAVLAAPALSNESASFAGQVVLLFAIPILSVLFAVLVAGLLGALKFLVRKQPIAQSHQPASGPPPLP